MGTAKDGSASYLRPQAAVTEPDDAMDDAIDVWFLLLNISQWAGSLLGDFNCYQDWYPILCCRMGRLGFNNG